MEFFELFGVEPRLQLDTGWLQQRFYQLSRAFHPDRFSARPASEREAAERQSARLNDAYRVLRDPIARTEYVLKKEGFDLGEQRSKDVPPELLEEVFELNLALEEARTGDAEAKGQLPGMHARFVSLRDAIDGELAALAAAHDAEADSAKRRQILQQVRALLNRRRYIRNLLNEVEKEWSHEPSV